MLFFSSFSIYEGKVDMEIIIKTTQFIMKNREKLNYYQSSYVNISMFL